MQNTWGVRVDSFRTGIHTNCPVQHLQAWCWARCHVQGLGMIIAIEMNPLPAEEHNPIIQTNSAPAWHNHRSFPFTCVPWLIPKRLLELILKIFPMMDSFLDHILEFVDHDVNFSNHSLYTVISGGYTKLWKNICPMSRWFKRSKNWFLGVIFESGAMDGFAELGGRVR